MRNSNFKTKYVAEGSLIRLKRDFKSAVAVISAATRLVTCFEQWEDGSMCLTFSDNKLLVALEGLSVVIGNDAPIKLAWSEANAHEAISMVMPNAVFDYIGQRYCVPRD